MTGQTIVDLGIDNALGLNKRDIFSELFLSEDKKEGHVKVREELLSPTSQIISSKNIYLYVNSDEYDFFDINIGSVIRSSIVSGITKLYSGGT